MVTGDIPFDITQMENRWYPLVPSIYAWYFWDIRRQAALTVCVLVRLGLASIGTGGAKEGWGGEWGWADGGTALPQTSMSTIYKQTLMHYDCIYTKIRARS